MNSKIKEMIIILFLVILPMLILPLVFTIINIVNLFFALAKKHIKNKFICMNDIFTMICGILFTFVLLGILEFRDYTQAIQITSDMVDLHAPIAAGHLPTILMLFGVGVLGYIILRIKKTSLPPIQIVILFSFMFIGIFISCIYLVQLSNNILTFYIFYISLFPINFILCSITLIKQTVTDYTLKISHEKNEYKSKILSMFFNLIAKTQNWTVLAIILTLPILIIVILVLTIFGQKPDSIVKAFTETSDWVLSQKISPPAVVVDAHYLCTVSLRGHKKIVKPLRYGIRRNERIVVNRQLLIANAFEQLIQEKTPKTHHLIRYIYDKYGYPLSKHITTKWSADIVYFLMKPLEWLFLIVIYCFDINPETRIAKQYLPQNYITQIND